MPILRSSVNPRSDDFARNRDVMTSTVEEFRALEARVREQLDPDQVEAFPEVQLVTVAFDGEDTAPIAKSFLDGVSDLPEHSALVGGEEADEAGLPEVFEVGSGQLPQTYLINPEGVVVWSRVGSVDAALLNRLLAQTK